MPVIRSESFLEHLLLPQSFDALSAPTRVEFTFLNTVARRKPNEGRAEKSTADSQAEKEKKPPQGVPRQFRGFFVFDHFPSKFARTALRHGFGPRIVLFFDLVHAAVCFRKKFLS